MGGACRHFEMHFNRDSGFIADRMLGRLAVWMRLIGLDTIYFNEVDEASLVEQALASGRIIVTRDRLLAVRKKIRQQVILLRGNDFRAQLKELIGILRLDPYERIYSRCLRCNVPIEGMARSEVAGKVPPYVFETARQFSRCPACGRIYWGATHRENALKEIREILYQRGE